MIWKGKKRHKPSKVASTLRVLQPDQETLLCVCLVVLESPLTIAGFSIGTRPVECSYPDLRVEQLPVRAPRSGERSYDTFMNLPLPDWPPDWPEIRAVVRAALASGEWGRYQSELCGQLTQRLCDHFSAAVCRLTCSGTAAIELALRAGHAGPGDEVILAAYDYGGNLRSVELLGATPVLVDVAGDSPCIDASQLDAAASDRVVAVIASHLYGRAAPVADLRTVCDERGWLLIEDACQVPGMEINGRPAGSFGDFATLSFGGSKLLTAGTGGALLVNNQKLAARLPALIERPSDAFPLSPLQAAVLGPQLDRLDQLNTTRAETARYLIDALPEVHWVSRIESSVQPAFYKLAWQSDIEPSPPPLPIGPGFRTTAHTSERRCRKPVPLQRSIKLSKTIQLLDHRALLIDTDFRVDLAAAIRSVVMK